METEGAHIIALVAIGAGLLAPAALMLAVRLVGLLRRPLPKGVIRWEA